MSDITETTWLTFIAPGKMIPIRTEPKVTASIVTHLTSSRIFCVHTKLEKGGFYKLSDGSGFVNSNTAGVQWIILSKSHYDNRLPEVTKLRIKTF